MFIYDYIIKKLLLVKITKIIIVAWVDEVMKVLIIKYDN